MGGGQGLEFLGGQGGPNSQQAHDVVTMSMRRNDVASTSFRRRAPIRFLINQCQIITFLILKYDIIENSRIELIGIVLPVQMGGLSGGPKGMLAPPLKLLGGPGPHGPHLFLRLCDALCTSKSSAEIGCRATELFICRILLMISISHALNTFSVGWLVVLD